MRQVSLSAYCIWTEFCMNIISRSSTNSEHTRKAIFLKKENSDYSAQAGRKLVKKNNEIHAYDTR